MNPVQTRPRPTLSVLDGVAMLVGVVVGVGIFKTPQIVATNAGTEWAFLGLWLIGGGITLIGALVYAELGAAYPSSGGEYHFLNRALSQKIALLFAWARATVVQPGAIAAVAFVFADYAQQLLPLGGLGPPAPEWRRLRFSISSDRRRPGGSNCSLLLLRSGR